MKASNEFKESLKVIDKEYQKHGKKMPVEDKIALAVYQSIMEVPAESREEEIIKMEYLMNMNKILSNYEELKPLLTEYFSNKRKEKLKELWNIK